MHFSQDGCCNTVCLHVSWTVLPLSSASAFLLLFCYFLNVNHKTNSHDKIHIDRWDCSLHAVRKKRLITKRALWPVFQRVAIYVLWYRAPVPGLTVFLWIYVIMKVNRYVLYGLTESQLMHRHILLQQNPKICESMWRETFQLPLPKCSFKFFVEKSTRPRAEKNSVLKS